MKASVYELALELSKTPLLPVVASLAAIWSVFGQFASHDGGCELSRKPGVKTSKAPNRHSLKGINHEWALLHQAFKSCNRHLVESPRYFTEAGGSIAAQIRSPANQRFFGKNQVCPGKDGEQVPSERVIPGGAEACEYRSLRPEEFIHFHKCREGIAEMLKGIDGYDGIHPLICIRTKLTDLFHSLLVSFSARSFE